MALHPYSSQPKLHANLVIASFQLLLWALFRPSAWKSFIKQVNPQLEPNSRLSELKKTDWQHPLLQRLVRSYSVYSLLIMLVSYLSLLLFQRSGEQFWIGLLMPLLLMILLFQCGGRWFGLPIGLLLSVLPSVAFGFAFAAVGSINEGVDAGSTVAAGLLIGLSGSIIHSVSRNMAIHSHNYRALAWRPELVSGAVVSFLLSALAIASAFNLLHYLGWTLFGAFPIFQSHLHWLVSLLLLALIVGLDISMVGKRQSAWTLWINLGVLLISLGFLSLYQSGYSEAASMGFVLLWISAFGLAYLIAERIMGIESASIASVLGAGTGWIIWMLQAQTAPQWGLIPLTLLSLVAGATITNWAAYLVAPIWLLWNQLLYRLDEKRSGERPSLFRYHSAFWDETHQLPLFNLDNYLVLIAERNPQEGHKAIAYLSTGYQRQAAQAAQIELDARRLEACKDVQAISSIHQSLATGELEGAASIFLRSFSRVSQATEAALNGSTTYHKRLALSNVEQQIEQILRDMLQGSGPYVVRFQSIMAQWQQLVVQALNQLAAEVERNQELENPYIFGVPLGQDEELFVGRSDLAARIELYLSDRRSPPLLLYGQRRMGKTSLLRNLGRLLPSSTVPLFVDGEGIAGAVNDADLLYAIASAMVRSAERHRKLTLPRRERAAFSESPFISFNEWLDELELLLEAQKSIALLAIDEFEVLDAIGQTRRFSIDDILRLLRHLGQHRPRFKVLLAGSHTLDEFRHWASYLINMQVIKISYLSPQACLGLIERPVKDFALQYQPEASQAIVDLTRGHPHFVQLICYEIVERKNQQPPAQRRLVTLDDVEGAVQEALHTGDLFFADLCQQIGPEGVAFLQKLAQHGPHAAVDRASMAAQLKRDDLATTIALLLHRDLIEEAPEGYRFQIELFRRWFAQAP
jgi:hypothetical protein